MEYNCGKFLNKYVDRSDIQASYNHHGSKAMVIVETRCGYWLPLVVRNAIDRLPNWNLYVVGPMKVINFIKEQVGGTFIPIVLDVEVMNIAMYNYLLMDSSFWKKFREQHILIFQMDCLLLREPSYDMLEWDYVGPLCGTLSESEFIMNGGLSLRKKDAMIKACETFTEDEKKLPEDVAFTKCMRRQKTFNLPNMNICYKFAIESLGDIDTAVGIHGTDKYYGSGTGIYEKLFATDK
jgi:hypothetical protein